MTTDPRLLQYFVAVAEELHFGHAARRLRIKQPPLSQAIQKLERDLGVQLLARTRRHVELTEAGETLLRSARLVLEKHDQFNVAAERVRTGQIGILRVGYTQSMPFLPAFTNALRRSRIERPDVLFELKSVSTRRAHQALIEQELDIAMVRSLLTVPPSLESLVVSRDRLMLVLPAGHRLARKNRIALRELADEPFIQHTRRQHTEFHEFLQRGLLNEARNSRAVLEANDTPTLMALVAAGLGISILPSTLKAIAIADLIWREIDNARDADLVSSLLAVYRPDHATHRALAGFIDLLRAQAR